jgi:hypothetical protein
MLKIQIEGGYDTGAKEAAGTGLVPLMGMPRRQR